MVQLARLDRDQDIRLRRLYANWALGLIAAQVLIADAAFTVYAWVGVGWQVPEAVMGAWLTATVVEVIGVTLVVARYLFDTGRPVKD